MHSLYCLYTFYSFQMKVRSVHLSECSCFHLSINLHSISFYLMYWTLKIQKLAAMNLVFLIFHHYSFIHWYIYIYFHGTWCTTTMIVYVYGVRCTVYFPTIFKSDCIQLISILVPLFHSLLASTHSVQTEYLRYRYLFSMIRNQSEKWFESYFIYYCVVSQSKDWLLDCDCVFPW